MKRLITGLFLLALSAGNATAQSQRIPETGHYNTDEARAAAETILRDTASTDGIWETSEDGRLHHVQSGATCLPIGSVIRFNSLTVFDTVEGSDVACHWTIQPNRASISLYVTRNKNEPAEALLAMATLVAQSRWNAERDGTPVSPVASNESPGALSTRLRFVRDNGQALRSSTWLNVVDGWTVKVRATYVADNADTLLTERMATLVWVQAAQAIVQSP